MCPWEHGGWSNSCLAAIAVGGVAGAIAGLTFNPALGLMAEAGLSGLTASVVAGAVSGAAFGAASYLTQGGLATATGEKFNWSVQDFALYVGVGALAGGALAGAGYGASRALSALRGSTDFVPNPGGRLGGPMHRKVVADIESDRG